MDTTSGIESRARELLDGRVAAVTELEQTVRRLEEAQRAVQTAEKNVKDAWGQASSAGWTVTELKQLGFTPPTAKSGRPRAAARRQSASGKRATDQAE